ncbi:MAG: hypothetical protein RL344_1493 [Pseudomonadota bacterium]
MNLFFDFSNNALNNQAINCLPYQGIVEYYGMVLQPEIADAYFQQLLYETPWQHDQAIMFGKHITTRRKVAWYGDTGFNYNYSCINHHALPWSALLLQIKYWVEAKLGVCYNSVLLNLYHNGSEGMGWHHDDEKGLGKNSHIASLSLGATRRFDLRHKNTKKTVSIDLEHGSLLAMYGETQSHWLHQIPKQLRVKDARISLTFRQFLG